MKKIVVAIFSLLLAGTGVVSASSTLVSSAVEFRKVARRMLPGDTLVLADGIWKDADLVIDSKGKPGLPVCVRAQTPGEVKLTGGSRLEINGRHIVVSGLWFYGPSTRKDSGVIIFGKKSSFCRVTDTRVESTDMIDADRDNWILIWGKYNRFDHCSVVGKKLPGQTLRYLENAPARPGDNFNRVDSCYFGPRPNINANGGESIQFFDKMFGGDTFEYNIMEECNGEAEIISVKSNRNTIRGNVFIRCWGEVVNRRGFSNSYLNNYFFGHGAPGTGGIRISDRDNRVINNYFHDLTLRGLEVKNGDTTNFYLPVTDLVVAHNTWINCDSTIKYGSGHRFKAHCFIPPVLDFANNIIVSSKGPQIFYYDQEHDPRVKYFASIFHGAPLGVDRPEGDIRDVDPEMQAVKINGYTLYKPASDGPAIGQAGYAYEYADRDIEGKTRGWAKDLGCCQMSDAIAVTMPIARSAVGPRWEQK